MNTHLRKGCGPYLQPIRRFSHNLRPDPLVHSERVSPTAERENGADRHALPSRAAITSQTAVFLIKIKRACPAFGNLATGTDNYAQYGRIINGSKDAA